jgi:hypothetical protein
MFLMWLGEQITERGLGNGISHHHLRRHRRRAADGDRRAAASWSAPARSSALVGPVHRRAGRRR